MIDIEQIKSEWASLKIENAALQQKNIDLTRRLATSRVSNNQIKLAKSYRVGYFGLIFPLLAWLLYILLHASIIVCVAYSLYGLVIAWFDLWFKSFVRKADYASMSTVDALSHASKVVIYQNWATIASIIACIALCIPLFYEMSQIGDHVVVGGIIGGCVGGIIGAIKCVRNHKLARRMLAELREIDESQSAD